INLETLEKVSNVLIQSINGNEKKSPQEEVSQEDFNGSQTDNQQEPSHKRRPRIQTQLAQGRRSFRLGQTGVTYKDLFGEYLKDAKEIIIEDPYIKAPHQFRNLVDFLGMLIDTRPVDGLKVKVITKEHDDLDKHAGMIDSFDTIKDDMVGYGIEFDYSFRDFHDRFIKTDTGWNISLGSGLDIYEKAENYTLASARQDRRKCREFSVIYTKE
ncbi:MAG: ATP-dependent Lon protease, partial [Muribaculaceae bacterium]|nr:ATP-dependent Lon protease [Muribaculaceae bacterium]